jgi:circadian clock protein KaiB
MPSVPSSVPVAPALFKGIALFTPGGDLIYCIDPSKQNRWHLHLCAALQELLGLPEPPHFLVPCYTATVDRWLDTATRQIRTVAEASPAVLRFQPLLNAIFATGNLEWTAASLPEGLCDPMVLATYRQQFPQLWETHELLVRYEQTAPYLEAIAEPAAPVTLPATAPQGYVFRLFVSGYSSATERTLQNLHALLEQCLSQPYTLKIIDVSQHPDQAECDQVTATPTLVKAYPLPMRRIVGNLDHVDQLLKLLGPLDDGTNLRL